MQFIDFFKVLQAFGTLAASISLEGLSKAVTFLENVQRVLMLISYRFLVSFSHLLLEGTGLQNDLQ